MTNEPEARRGYNQHENLLPMTGRVPRMHNITWHDEAEDPEYHLQRTEDSFDSMPAHPEIKTLLASHPLHTTQSHYGTKGIRRYVNNPNASHLGGMGHVQTTDPEDEELPQIYRHGGLDWINEGHHRILASRLRGESSIQVYYWNAE
jgi:hypothetical protein